MREVGALSEPGIPILISLSATATPEGEQPDAMQLLTSGQLILQGRGYLICYEEQLDETQESTKVRLTLEDGAVTMLRSGPYETNLVFCKGQRYESQYSTPFGEMDLAIFCTRATYAMDDLGGSLHLIYQLDLNGQFVSMHDLEMRFVVKEGDARHAPSA